MNTLVRQLLPVIGMILTVLQVQAQNCPADLEWPSTTAPAPGTIPWPKSLLTQHIITDRHPSASARIQETPHRAIAVGETICDPAFNTSITRATPAGHAILDGIGFSADATWLFTIGMDGGFHVFAFDPIAGRVRLSNGSPVRIPVTFEMLPRSEKDTICSPTSFKFSPTEPDIIYMSACGARIFKYNLRAYDPLRPMAGLVAGSNPRSVASFPTKCATCRKGPVFIDLTDIFGDLADEGFDAKLDLTLDSRALTFSGTITRFNGYKNVQGYFVYRPAANALWFAKGSKGLPGQPDPYLMLTATYDGKAVNRRIIGGNLDTSGRYFTTWVCADAVASYDSCSTGAGYVIEIDSQDRARSLTGATIKILNTASHGNNGPGMAFGHLASIQALGTFYYDPAEVKTLPTPNLVSQQSNWFASYSSDATASIDRYGRPLAAGFSTYSYESWWGTPTPLSGCPHRNCRYANELILHNLSGTHFIRLAHTRSTIREAGGAYWDLPRLSLSPDGAFLAFVSNWGSPSTPPSRHNNSIYVVRVPPAWRELLDDRLTMTPTRIATVVDKSNTVLFSHPRSDFGTHVLIADRRGNAASTDMSRACYFHLTSDGRVRLADDKGVLSRTGFLGTPFEVLSNHSCSINLATSAVLRSNHGNQEYRIHLTFLAPSQERVGWQGQTMRVSMSSDPTNSASWLDTGFVNGPVDDIGIYRTSTSGWALDVTSNSRWEDFWDKAFAAGVTGDLPVTGRWAPNLAGTKTGVFRQGGAWLLDLNGDSRWTGGVDRVCYFGIPNDVPIVGNWLGSAPNGKDKIGVYRRGWWYLDSNANCAWDDNRDRAVLWGTGEDLPVVGDWDGSGTDRAGLYRNGVFTLDINGDFRFTPGVDFQVTLGQPGDIPLSGRWFSDGVSLPTVYRPSTGEWITARGVVVRAYGFPGDLPIKGGWDDFRFWQ